MALNIKDLLKVKPLTTVETSIGELCIFSISIGHQQDLLESLSTSIKEVDSLEYLKKLLTYVCYPINDLKDGEYKPDNPVLTLEKIDELSGHELEGIAKEYIINNEYLFKNDEFRKQKDTDGQEVHSLVYTDIKYPRYEGESYVNYLHRLACLEEDKQNKRMKRILDSIPNVDSFSKALSGGIAKNFMLGDSITNSIKSTKSVRNLEFISRPSPLDTIDWAEIERNKERVRREPFNELAQRLDELINSSNQASEFMVKANKLQTEIAAEIKAGGDTTDRHARNNIKLSIIVIILTVSGLVVSGWSTISGVSFSKQQQQALSNYASDLSESMANNSKAVENSGNESQLALKEILSALNILNGNLTSNQESISDMNMEIESLKNANESYKRKIEELNYKIKKIESANK